VNAAFTGKQEAAQFGACCVERAEWDNHYPKQHPVGPLALIAERPHRLFPVPRNEWGEEASNSTC
jgi:hypothetical protein